MASLNYLLLIIKILFLSFSYKTDYRIDSCITDIIDDINFYKISGVDEEENFIRIYSLNYEIYLDKQDKSHEIFIKGYFSDKMNDVVYMWALKVPTFQSRLRLINLIKNLHV